MSFSKYKELNNLSIVEIDKELYVLQKSLFDLRMKKMTNQTIKPHLFLHAKRRISQLKLKRHTLLKTEKTI